MKPLDLNVSIQNSYEAARTEAVRLEREHVLNRLAGEESMREQRVRDAQVNQPEAKIMHEDLFSAEAYEPPDYTQTETPDKRKKQHHQNSKESGATSSENAANPPPEDSSENTGHFSTYA